MKVAIIQSSYIPWKGYFDIINDVDIFVFLDDVQYTKKDWRNRNKIKTPKGIKWLTVPVVGGTKQKICETKIDYKQNWIDKHKKTIHRSYASSDYYKSYKDDLFKIYQDKPKTISELNISAIKQIASLLGISTKFIASTELNSYGLKDDKLIDICQKIGADTYLSGPNAKNYLSEEKFTKAGIELEYKDYSDYPEYKQLWGDFNHYVSIIDLIFNCGDDAPYYIWEHRDKSI